MLIIHFSWDSQLGGHIHAINRLIELVAYHYQDVVSAVLKATMDGMEKLSMLRVEQYEDG
jgi:hypothetical protein